MIPRTFPSALISGERAMTVYPITDLTGLVEWTDYIPVKEVAAGAVLRGTYATAAAYPVKVLSDITGLYAGRDYIRVYVDATKTVPWSTNSDGFIPIEAVDGAFTPPVVAYGFDAATATTGVSLSPDTFTATLGNPGGVTWNGVKSITTKSLPVSGTASYCVEFVLDDVTTANGDYLSLALYKSTDDLTTNNFTAANILGIGVDPSQTYNIRPGTAGSLGTAVNGDIIGLDITMTTTGVDVDCFINGVADGGGTRSFAYDPADIIHIGAASLYPEAGGTVVTLITDPGDMTYAGSYSNQNGWA